jgi:DNA polymerase-3 subunit beta
MKFIIDRESLLAPLQPLVSVIEKRQTMPVLSNVLLVITDETLTMTGTDLEVQLIAKLAIPSATDGAITVPARKFLDICRLLPTASEIKVISNKSRFSLNCLPANTYPEFSQGELERHFFISSGHLKKALEKTTFCMANQDVRYYLNGILLHISNSKLKFVASDGHRLSIYEGQLEIPTGFEERIILPRKGVLELMKLLDDSDAELKIEFSSSSIRIYMHQYVFSAKLVDSKYPDFNRVFEKAFFNPLHVDKIVLKNSLTRVAILSNEKFKGITFDINAERLKINTHNPEHDEAEEELSIIYEDEPLSIAFNAQYLSDALSHLEGDTAILTIASDASSCFISEPLSAPYKFIVMAMRL